MTRTSHIASHTSLVVTLALGSMAVFGLQGCRTAAATPDKTAGADPALAVPAEQAPPVADPSMTPEAFAKAVARADLLEISLGKLAVQNADAPSVKDFGQRMVTNHTAIQVIITKIATKQGIELPTSPNGEDAATVNRFTALQGVEFDKAYMTFMAEAHPKTLAMFKWQYDNCSDPALAPFAKQTMPIIGTHTRVAEQLNAEVNKEELRLAKEQKDAELKAAELKRQEDAAIAAAAAAKKPAPKRAPPKKTTTMGKP